MSFLFNLFKVYENYIFEFEDGEVLHYTSTSTYTKDNIEYKNAAIIRERIKTAELSKPLELTMPRSLIPKEKLTSHINVTIERYENGVKQVIFKGFVGTFTIKLILLRLDCVQMSANRTVLDKHFMKNCNYQIYDKDCKLTRIPQKQKVRFVENDLRSIHVDLKYEDVEEEKYVGGLFEINDIRCNIIAQYPASSGFLGVILDKQVFINSGDDVELSEGCGGTLNRCKELGNRDNFYGFACIPTKDVTQI